MASRQTHVTPYFMRVLRAQFSERYYENYESLQNSIDTEETMQAPENRSTFNYQLTTERFSQKTVLITDNSNKTDDK